MRHVNLYVYITRHRPWHRQTAGDTPVLLFFFFFRASRAACLFSVLKIRGKSESSSSLNFLFCEALFFFFAISLSFLRVMVFISHFFFLIIIIFFFTYLVPCGGFLTSVLWPLFFLFVFPRWSRECVPNGQIERTENNKSVHMHVYACVNEIWKTRVEAQRVQLLTAPLDRKVNSFFFFSCECSVLFCCCCFYSIVCVCVYVCVCTMLCLKDEHTHRTL